MAELHIDRDLQAGIELLEKGEKIDKALKLINKSARKGISKGKSFFEVGRIIREGVSGIEPSVAESRRYFDEAMVHFLNEQPNDALDYREMGDYWHYGLGSEPINREKAREYYNLALQLGDTQSETRLSQVEEEIENGTTEISPEISKDTHAPESKVNEQSEVKEVVKESENPQVAVSQEDKKAEKEVSELEDGEQLLIRAIRLLDSPSASESEKKKGLEYANMASKAGVMRASVLMGYLYEGKNSLVPCDYKMAKDSYELAIARGSVSAEYRLGLLYTDPEVPYADAEKGHKLILSAARRGYPYALNYIGDCFRAKVSDPRYLDLAYRYYSLAGERGLGLSYHNMAEIDASRQEIQLAQLHERYAADNGYDPEAGSQDPLFTTIRC